MTDLTGKKSQEKLHKMKAILFILLYPFTLTCQTSFGFVLDGSYNIGHNCHITASDTVGQAPSEANVPECFKFNLNDNSDQINQLTDSSFTFTYPGVYFVNMNFIVSKSSNDASMDELYIYGTQNRTKIKQSSSKYQIFNDNSISGVYYNKNYFLTSRFSASDTLKLKYFSTTADLQFNAIGADAMHPGMPAIYLQIFKLSE